MIRAAVALPGAAAAAILLAGCSAATLTAISKTPAETAAASAPAEVPYRWTHGHSTKSYKALLAGFGRGGLKPGEFLWAEAIPKEGDTRVVVDLVTQMAYVWRGDALVGASTISSGKRGKETPLGIWPVLEKKKFHRSRKYDDAPMPFMQRLDEYGIALHGGATPGYPASHGCVRLPMKFAEKLYALTKVGTEVVIEG